MAKRALGATPRSLVFLLLVGFVVVATGVIARRTYGIVQSRRIQELEHRRAALEGELIRLESAVRDASSRGRLAPVAEQLLQMHVATPNQIIMLPRPARGTQPTQP